MRAEKLGIALQRFRKYSSSFRGETAGFVAEKRRRFRPFSAVFEPGANEAGFVHRIWWGVSAGAVDLPVAVDFRFDTVFFQVEALFRHVDVLFLHVDTLFLRVDTVFFRVDTLFGHVDRVFLHVDALFQASTRFFQASTRFSYTSTRFFQTSTPLTGTASSSLRARARIAGRSASSRRSFRPSTSPSSDACC